MLLRNNTKIECVSEKQYFQNSNLQMTNPNNININSTLTELNLKEDLIQSSFYENNAAEQSYFNSHNIPEKSNMEFNQINYNTNITNFPTISLADEMLISNSQCTNLQNSVTYQDCHNIASSSSSAAFPIEMNSVNHGNDIKEHISATTPLISKPSNSYSSDSSQNNFLSPIYNNNSSNTMNYIQQNNPLQFNRATSHMGLVPNSQNLNYSQSIPETQTINHLSHSFSNFTINNSQPNSQWNSNSFQKPNGSYNSIENTNRNLLSNKTNFNDTNQNSLNHSHSWNSSSRSLPQSCLSQNNLQNKDLQSVPYSMSISTPAVIANPSNLSNINNSKSNLTPPLLGQQKYSFTGSNPNNLTPSRRMINVMEERMLIPPTGIMNPIPNLMHITKKPNCDPSIMRCTMNAVPNSDDILNKTRLPLVLLIHPFKDLANLQVIRSEKIVRCRTISCRAYLNPFVSFSDQKRWKCNICQRINELSDDFLYDESVGAYIEPQKRAEIRLATVEYIAPKEYSMKSFQVPVYVFMIDISVNSVSSLYSNTLNRILTTIEELLDRLPGQKHAKFSLIGYDSNIHLYHINDKKFQEIILSDLSEPIEVPITTGILVDLHNYRDQIQEVLISLLDNVDNDLSGQPSILLNCLGSALLLAKQIINNSGGRITIFNSSCPNIGEGVLTVRDCKKSNNVFPLAPDKEFYKTLSLEFAQAQVGVDIFQLGKLPCDLASLSIISRYCGGSVFYYPDLSVSLSKEKQMSKDDKPVLEIQRLLYDLNRYLIRKIGFDAVLRVRYSSGLNILSTHGNFFSRACDLYAMANVNPDSGIAIRLGMSDSYLDQNVIYFQAALLYTSSLGERRIRVHTIGLPVSSQIDDVFRMADHQVIAGFLVKSVSDKLQSTGKVIEAREALINAVVDPSTAFGEFCLSSSQRLTSLPFPFHLRLLPLYVWGILQSKCLHPTHNDPDSSVALLDTWRNLPLSYLLVDIYPSLFNITSVAFINCKDKERMNNKSDACSLVDDAACNIDDVGIDPEYSTDSDESSWESEACSGISCYNNTKHDHNNLSSAFNDNKNSSESDEEDLWYPEQLHLTMQSLNRSEVYLLDTSKGLIMLMGIDTPRIFFRQIFGVDSFSELPSTGNIQLPELNNSSSVQLRVFIKELQIDRPIGSHLFVINNNHSSLNSIFQSHLLEDDRIDTSYHRFLKHIQRKINK